MNTTVTDFFLKEAPHPSTLDYAQGTPALYHSLCHSQGLINTWGHTDLWSNSSSVVNNLGVPAALISSKFLFSHFPSIHSACSHCLIMDLSLATLRPGCFESSPRISVRGNKLREKASRHPGPQLVGTSLNKAPVLPYLGD